MIILDVVLMLVEIGKSEVEKWDCGCVYRKGKSSYALQVTTVIFYLIGGGRLSSKKL